MRSFLTIFRMAVGTRRRDVLWQFLIEALSLIGCAIGLALGIGGAWLVGKLADLPVAVAPASVLMTAGVSFLLGVFWLLPSAPRLIRLRRCARNKSVAACGQAPKA